MLKTVSSITNAIGALNYKGTWDANANSPALTSSVGTKGDYYVVGTAGATNLNDISNWGVGDWAAFNGSVWQRVEGGANLNGVDLSVSGTSTLSGLTASTALALDASKIVVSVTNTGTGNNVLANAPTFTGGATSLGNNNNFTVKWLTDAGVAGIRFLKSDDTLLWDISGGVFIGQDEMAFRHNGTTVLYLQSDNAVKLPNIGTTASSANAFLDSGNSNNILRSTSSLRYKTAVEPVSDEFSAKVLQLEPIWYRSTADADNKAWSYYGLGAEQVAEVEPRLVHWTYLDSDYDTVPETFHAVIKDEERNDVVVENTIEKKVLKTDAKMVPDAVMYDRIGVLLLQEVKKMKSEIQSLKSEIATLKGA